MGILDILCRLDLKLFTGEMGMDRFMVTIDRNTRTLTLTNPITYESNQEGENYET